MCKRLTLYLALLALLSVACSLTAAPAVGAAMAATSQPPTPQPNPPTQPAPSLILAELGGDQPAPTPAALACIVNAQQALNVRACPGVTCPVIGWLSFGDPVTVATVAGGWARLGGGGWANAEYLTCGGR